MPDLIELDEPLERIALFGGVYNNYLALDAVLEDAAAANAQKVFCLGDVGGFGPYPDRSVDRLRTSDVLTLQGNYDDSVGNGLEDCQCGYTDPRDNHYARISYDYTLKNTNDENRGWLRDLPPGFRVRVGDTRLLMCHGSPRQVNEFLWESTTPEPFVRRLLRESDTDFVACTHTGIFWESRLADDPGRGVVNVGAIGRPPNDGHTGIWYALVTAGDPIEVEMRRVDYDHEQLATDMRAEKLPEEFVETILTGWWTTCLEILPAKERARGTY